MPDFLVFCAAFAKLTGAKVVAYMNEPTPELAQTIFGSPRITRLMVRFEQAALRFADRAVTVTPQLRDRYAERGADASRISVVLNGTDRSTLLAGWTALRRAAARRPVHRHLPWDDRGPLRAGHDRRGGGTGP